MPGRRRVTVDLRQPSATGFASIAGIENVTGGSGDDTLTGDDNANLIDGGLGGGHARRRGGRRHHPYDADDVSIEGGDDTDTLGSSGRRRSTCRRRTRAGLSTRWR